MYSEKKIQKLDTLIIRLKIRIKSYKYNKIKTNLIQQQNLCVMIY